MKYEKCNGDNRVSYIVCCKGTNTHQLALCTELTSFALHNGQVVVEAGDDPVEIKDCHKFEGITLRIASDEVQKYDLKAEKRTRLIKSGADILINDFSQHEKLIETLSKIINYNG